MEIGDRIAEARKAKGLTQEELAHEIGISRPNMCRYETGSIKEIPDKMIVRIADALRVTPTFGAMRITLRRSRMMLFNYPSLAMLPQDLTIL